MIKLFSEKVTPFTSSNLNIIQVENFDEVFFDVYEFEINGSKYIAEKVGVYSDDPVVSVPIVEGSSRLEAPFILRKGKFEVYYNPSNSKFLETITEEVDSVIELPVIKDEVEEELSAYNEKKEQELTNFVKLIVKDKLKALQDKVNTTSDLAKANLTKDVEQLAESLKLTLNSKQQDLSNTVVNLVREEFNKVVKVVDHAIDKKSKILDTKLYGQV